MAQVVGFLPPTWETQSEFLDLARPCPGSHSLYLSTFSLSLFHHQITSLILHSPLGHLKKPSKTLSAATAAQAERQGAAPIQKLLS